MKVYYYNNATNENPEWSKNWGDIIAPTIIKHFSKSDKIDATNEKVESKLVSIGSVMLAARPNDLIWGTGCIEYNQYLPDLKRVNVFATRGPLTRTHLLHLGHSVPEVYGDPGLLYPMVYNPKVENTHEWGIIPHYMDLNNPIVKHLIDSGVKLIDICAGEREFVDQLKSVNKVISSSLHGLIAADAYGIPNARISLNGNIVGGDFKYQDYALSVNRRYWGAIKLTKETDLTSIKLNTEIDWDADKLLNNAPWNKQEYKHLFYNS